MDNQSTILKHINLIQKIRSGDENAFSELVGIWHTRIYNFALRYSNEQHFAEEVVQKTFIQVYEKIHQLEDVCKFQPWLYRITSNCCLSQGRVKQRYFQFIKGMNESHYNSDAIDDPGKLYDKREREQMVAELLQILPEEQRTVILMKEYEGLKFREIAEILGESENTVKSRMYYGLDAMRKYLSNQKYIKELYYE